MAAPERFRIEIPERELDELRERLDGVRWAGDFANEQWQYGAEAGCLRELAAYWRDGFDWRAQEAAMNVWPHYRVVLDGVPVHYMYVRGTGPAPVPIVLSHGWPWTFWDFHKIVGPLADPAAHGGDAADAFDVVVPSLPGYGFSSPLSVPGINFWRTAELWVRLMCDVLGYERFGAHGGDWGALITAQLGHAHAQRLLGIHTNLPVPLDLFGGGGPGDADYAVDEQDRLARTKRFWQTEGGYYALQTTKPQTAAFALEDSPAGLLAWIVEKRRTWSDCDGELERRFTRDELLTTVSLYWFTRTIGTSMRYYYEAFHHPWRAAHDRQPVVEAPAAISVFPGEVIYMARSWVERYFDVRERTEHASGGHFAPMEEPQALVEDLRGFFRRFR